MKKEKQTYEKELLTLVLTDTVTPRQTLRELFENSAPSHLLQGRRCVGVKKHKITGKEEAKYKITSYEVVLENGFRYKISKYLFKELWNRY